ncbi:hypothetical protein AAE02nite_04250 [Adhaeribacter aerolatus]|uniref:Uncharacterized protein n=1 Tax=Adhaeribacter aerolatus TaxID=670289 RepID=A0A512ASU1_9BACT|nr:hypothetical protein [Adhaeribacter aerolatus]GEO02761.1 hypothetical protein AAE02nite_04250 [Adhaeribacter aerolatus]
MKSIMPIKQRFKVKQKFKLKYAAVLASLKLAVFISLFIGVQSIALAQQPSQIEQAKLDIWTETASFVYRDAKLAEPQNIVNATTLKQFEEAIRQEDSKSQIYSKLYRPIEQTGTYKRGKDAKAQLDLLIKSINAKLRENEQRMKDINRRQQLSDLYKQLQQIASDYVNPAVVAGAGLPDDPTTGDAAFTAPDATETDPDTAVESAFAENQLSSLSKKQPQDQTKTTDWMTTAALLLSILSLGLIYFLYTKINALNKRMDQRKKDIDYLTQQVNAPGRKTPSGNGQLSREEIESLVQKAVARETAKLTNGSTPAVAPKASVPAPALPKEAPKPKVELPAESEEALLNPPPAPVAVQPEPTPAPTPAPDKPQSKFARVPVNGGFHEQDLHPTQQHDSIYEIRVSRKDPSKAAFRIVPNSPVHRTAIESAYLSLKDACQYQLNNQHATRIITDEPGTLSYQDGFWRIDKKANIHFE